MATTTHRKGFKYEATDPDVNMGSYEVLRNGVVLGIISRLDASENGAAGWHCTAGFFRTRDEAARALYAAKLAADVAAFQARQAR